MKNRLKRALRNGELSVGTWIQIGHPGCAEILARAGFGWVCVDLEHGAIDFETMANIFRTLEAHDCIAVARIPQNDPVWIHRSLDAGARGLIVPMIKTAEEARSAVREAKYPPQGVRGFGYSRANLHGADFDEYVAQANDEIAVIMQIEHKDAIANLDSILEVEGIDGLFIGPLDLSGSMGIPGDLDHPEMVRALELFRDACRRHHVAAGLHIVHFSEDRLRRSVSEGYTLVALGMDNTYLYAAAQGAMETVRSLQRALEVSD